MTMKMVGAGRERLANVFVIYVFGGENTTTQTRRVAFTRVPSIDASKLQNFPA